MSGMQTGSPNLGITHLAQSQNSAEVTVNSAIDALDNAENAATVVSFASSAAVTLTQAQFTGAQMFRCQGLTAASTLTVPTSMRDFNVRNEGSYPLTVGGATGATVSIPANTTCGLQNDGTDTLLVTSSAGANPGVQFANGSGNVGGVATLLTVSTKFILTSPSAGAVNLDINTAALGGISCQGGWNAATNTPALTNTPPAAGQFYVVSTAGTTSITGREGPLNQWNVNDQIMSDGSYWFRIEGAPPAVTSVAGRTGAITLAVADVSGAAPLNSPTLVTPALQASPAAGDDSLLIPSTSWVQSYVASLNYVSSSGAPVTSVVGQTGAVTLAQLVTAGVAPTQNATLTTPKLAAAPAATDNSLLIVSSSWVQTLLTNVGLGSSGGSYTTFATSYTDSAITLSNGNLTATGTSASSDTKALSSSFQSTGKFYFEATPTSINSGSNGDTGIGIANSAATGVGLGNNATAGAIVFPSGHLYIGGSQVGTVSTLVANTVVGIAVDLVNNEIWFRSGATGNWNNNASANPATNTGGYSIAGVNTNSGVAPVAVIASGTTYSWTLNAGASAFSGAVPSGFTSGWSGPQTQAATLGSDGRVPWAQLKPEAQNLPLAFVLPGKPAASAIFNLVSAMAITIPANFAGTVAYAATTATANAAFTLNHIAGGTTTAIGTITFTSSGHTSITLSSQAAVSIAAGDVLQLSAPSSQDATLADIGLTILAAKV